MKRIFVFIISLALAVSLFAGVAFADDNYSPGENVEDDPEIIVIDSVKGHLESETVVIDTEKFGNNNELLMDYIEDSVNNSSGNAKTSLRKSAYGFQYLSGIDRIIYGLLRNSASLVAQGDIDSTIFSFFMSELGLGGYYSAEDLGVDAVYIDDDITAEAFEALVAKLEAIDLDRIVTALLYDCPAEFFWFEKTLGCEYSVDEITVHCALDPTTGDYVIFFSDTMQIDFSFYVAEDFAVDNESGTFVVDSNVIDSIQTAIENANVIVLSHAQETDYQKLVSYKNDICTAVSYNTEAGHHNYTYDYGNPWQLIWVFDEDDSTNVVCEGYSKAFQFLCDNSIFHSASVQSRIVSGEMLSGNPNAEPEPHMWNVVTMDDGQNYLVDVTNCDSGTIGFPDELFLAGTDDEYDENDGYLIPLSSGGALSYIYGEETLDFYSADGEFWLLELAETDYDASSASGHTYGDPEWNWSADHSTATATFSCTACDYEETVEAEVARTTAASTITYTATAVHEGAEYTDVQTEEMGVRLEGADVSLRDRIIIRFFMTKKKGEAADYTVVYTLKGVTHELSLASLPVQGGMYRLDVPVVAKEMTEPIDICVKDNNGHIVSNQITYSVETYCKNKLSSTDPQYKDLRDLCAAILNYGAYAQNKFGYNLAALANRSLADYGYSTDVSLVEIPEEEVLKVGETEGINAPGADLLLEDAIVIRFYFSLDAGETISNYEFFCNGEETEAVKSGNYYLVYVRGVAAKNMDNRYTIVVKKDGQGTLSVEYGILTYLHKKKNGNDTALGNLCRAMYHYHLTAKEYFANHPN